MDSSEVTQSTNDASTGLILGAFKKLSGLSKFAVLVAGLAAVSMVLSGGVTVAGNDLKQLEIQLEVVRSAKDVTLMLVPRGVSYRSRITKEALPKAACVYHVSSVEGAVSANVIQILKTSALEYEADSADIGDVRVGVFFKGKGISQEFYFQDWEGRQNVSGISGEYRILALSSLPDLLRALVLQPGVVLVNNAFGGCSRPLPASP